MTSLYGQNCSMFIWFFLGFFFHRLSAIDEFYSVVVFNIFQMMSFTDPETSTNFYLVIKSLPYKFLTSPISNLMNMFSNHCYVSQSLQAKHFYQPWMSGWWQIQRMVILEVPKNKFNWKRSTFIHQSSDEK